MKVEWIVAAKQGDRAAFSELVRHFSAMAYIVAFEQLQDAYSAEDAVQEAFVEAFLHLNQLREPQAFPGWLKRIVVRQCRRQIRKKRQPLIPLHDALHAEDGQADVHAIAERRERHRQLYASIKALSDNLRVVVQLFYFEGYSLQEISECLGVAVPALKKRLFDARQKLRGLLPVADFGSVLQQLYGRESRMLHIVNGDSVGDKLREGVVQGDVLVWREIYSEGPVFADGAKPDHRQMRAHYLEQAMGIPSGEFIGSSEAQEQVLTKFSQYDDIVLWFEHDLFDQTMLSYLLHWFSRQSLGAVKLHLLCIGEFPGISLFHGLGQLTKDQLQTLSGTWKLIGQEELQLGREIWEAYTAADPGRLQQLLERDTSALPFAERAFRLHLARYPAVGSGIGIVERLTMERIAEGVNGVLQLFVQVSDQLHEFGLGDLQYWTILSRMCGGQHALLKLEGAERFPDFQQTPPDFLQSKLFLTPYGRRVLHREADWVSDNGMDQWYGGVHLHGTAVPWRWDEAAARLQAIKI